MSKEKQPEAFRLADALANNQRWRDLTVEECESAAAELRRQHRNIVEMEALNISRLSAMESLKKELAAEAARAANEKLRADQMTEQHRMQSNIRADVEAERDRYRTAYNEWHDKTEWVQKTSKGKELRKHRADVLRERIADLEARLSAIGAGGVESLSKIGPARGQAGFEAWWRDKYPSFAMHAPDVWEAAMHHAAQPSRECLQHSAAPAPAPQGENIYAALPKPAATGLGDEYEAFDRDGRAMGKAYETILYFTADQMRAFADDTAALRAIPEPAPAAVAVPDADDAARFKAQHDFLKWNRAQQDPLVKVAGEYGVFNKAVDLYRAALAAGPASASDTESVLIDGIAYEVPAAVAGELLSLHLNLLAAAPAQPFTPAFADGLLHSTVLHKLWEESEPTVQRGQPGALAWQLGVFAGKVAQAAAAPAQAVAVPGKALPYEPTSHMLIAAREHDPALPIETIRAIYWSMWRTAPAAPAQEHAAQLAGRHPIEALPDGHLYGEVNNLLTHIGMEGSIDLDHAFVRSTMAALAAIDGGVYLDNLAATTQAPALEQDVRNALAMLEEGEWAEHFAKTELGKRLEAAITELHSELNAAAAPIQAQEDAPALEAPAAPVLQAPPLTPDEARRAARTAELWNGPSDTTGGAQYAMAGALALAAKLAAAPQAPAAPVAVLADWDVEGRDPVEMLDKIYAVYQRSMGKPAPDAEMAEVVSLTKDMLLAWWGEHRDAIRAALSAAPAAPAVDAQGERDAAFEAVRNRMCGLQRYSFVLDDDGVVRRAQDRTGNWIEFDDAHELFDPVAVDAAIAAQAKGGAARAAQGVDCQDCAGMGYQDGAGDACAPCAGSGRAAAQKGGA